MQCSLRRRALAALLAGLLALDLVLNLWWHHFGKPLKDLHVGCKAAPADLPSLGRRVAGSERALLLTVLRHEQAEEATNFLAHVKAAGLLPRLLAVVLDEPSATLAVEYSVAPYRVRIRGVDAPRPAAVCAASAEDWLDSSAQVQAARWRYFAALVDAGLQVWVADVRVVWLRDPLSAWLPPAQCDLALVSEAPFGHELPAPRGNASDGDAHARSLILSLSLGLHRPVPSVAAWHLRVGRRLSEHGAGAGGRPMDLERQIVAEELARCPGPEAEGPEAEGPEAEGPEARQAAPSEGCPRWCVLPAPLFPNGLQYFQHRVPQSTTPPSRPVAVLASWLPRAQLRYRLLEEGLWRADPPHEEAQEAQEAQAGGPERFIVFKELVINNGLSNTRNALRSALAIAQITNRTLILPPLWSRHLHGEPYRVGVDYYFDWSRLQRAFPRVREAAYLRRAFPSAAAWPPDAWPLFFVQLHAGEQLCHERTDAPELLERLGNVNETCPPLQLRPGQLRTLKAKHFHLGASEAELRAWLAPHAHEPLLYFGRMFRRFHRFTSAEQHADFTRRFAWGVQPAPEIRAVAAHALQRLRRAVGGGGFNCVHMRRRDFVADHTDEQSVDEYARRAHEVLHRQSSRRAQLPLYLASDVAEDASTRVAFGAHFGRVLTLLEVLPPWELDSFGSIRHSTLAGRAQAAALAQEMRLGNVEQLVCSEAERFVGNKWSSFTHHVCFLRQERGFRAACDEADIYGREIDSRMEYV